MENARAAPGIRQHRVTIDVAGRVVRCSCGHALALAADEWDAWVQEAARVAAGHLCVAAIVETGSPAIGGAVVLDGNCLEYRVELRPCQAEAFAAFRDGSDSDLHRLILAINAAMPRMSFPDITTSLGHLALEPTQNPNNGKHAHRFLVGREGSRVLYAGIATCYLANRKDGRAFGFEGLDSKMRRLAEAARCDEFSGEVDRDVVGNETEYRWRFWWD